ncbi:MAG: response regulator [Colwellia sp.]|nr:response regulator [Colwellia sp.]
MNNEQYKSVNILLVDDDDDDCLLTKKALSHSNLLHKLTCVGDGQELMDYLYRKEKFQDQNHWPSPDIILLDLNMPRKDGREALKEIRSNADFKHIPIIVLTTAKEEEEVLRSYNLGANAFITKPVTFDGFIKAMDVFSEYWFSIVRLPKPSL